MRSDKHLRRDNQFSLYYQLSDAYVLEISFPPSTTLNQLYIVDLMIAQHVLLLSLLTLGHGPDITWVPTIMVGQEVL